jgi:16S rRNA (uracil1498-N3)-methyltransferase
VIEGAGFAIRLGDASEGERRADPRLSVTLILALLKGDHTEWALQKATEAGVLAVHVAVCDRSVPRPRGPDLHRRAERLRKVASEAARQCGRAEAPAVDLHAGLAEAVGAAATAGGAGDDAGRNAGLPCFLLDEGPGVRPLAALLAGAPGAILAVGPEGSFTDRERALMGAAGYRPAGLGPRVLRAETAAVAAVVLAQVVAGDMGPDGAPGGA